MEITRRHAEAALTHLDACEKILKASTARVLPNDAYENLLDHLEDAQAAADLARSTPHHGSCKHPYRPSPSLISQN